MSEQHFAPCYLVTLVGCVDGLLAIADVREPVNVCFQGKTGKHMLVLSFSQFDPIRTWSLVCDLSRIPLLSGSSKVDAVA
jgi:hypothetical protein